MLRRGLVIALTCGFALAACSDDGRPAAKPTPTPPTATPTPTGTPSPTVPVIEKPTLPPATNGAKGQEAFATYVVEAWAYALASNDVSVLTDVSAGRKPCQGCKELAAELAERTKDGWSVYPFDVTIDRVRLIQSELGTTARVRFDVPETKSLFDDGSLRNTSPAHPDATFSVSLRLERKTYQLIRFTIS